MARSLIILNPYASRMRQQGDRTALLDGLQAALARRDGTPPHLVETAAQAQTRPAVEAAIGEGVAAVVGVGGDGTLREIAAALAGTGVPMGIVPAGTGNLLAGILGIPTSMPGAVAAIESSELRTIDLGAVRLRLVAEREDDPTSALATNAGPPREERAVFAIGCGAGFDARVMAATPGHLKQRLGRAAYFAQAIRLAARIDAVPYRITVDGETIEVEASIALVANMGQLVPGAIGPRLPIEFDDGLLDLIVVGARGPIAGVRGLADQLFRTSPGGGSGSSSLRLQCRSVKVEADRAEPLQVDGDPVGWGSLEASVLPAALHVLVPRPQSQARPRAWRPRG
jgi:diacylglycerol kinase (ATP)